MFALKCKGCNMAITEGYISALSAQWHPQCFVCRVSRFLTFFQRHLWSTQGKFCLNPLTGATTDPVFVLIFGRKNFKKFFSFFPRPTKRPGLPFGRDGQIVLHGGRSSGLRHLYGYRRRWRFRRRKRLNLFNFQSLILDSPPKTNGNIFCRMLKAAARKKKKKLTIAATSSSSQLLLTDLWNNRLIPLLLNFVVQKSPRLLNVVVFLGGLSLLTDTQSKENKMLMLLLIDWWWKIQISDWWWSSLYFLSFRSAERKQRQIQNELPIIQIRTRRLFERKQNNIRPPNDRVVVYY